MSAKILDALEDEGSDLRRQIGCMTGILQLFDRQHVLPGRRSSLPNQNRLRSGSTSTEPFGCSPQVVPEKNRSSNENQRLSMESSRNSFSSSSCSSSFSSLECNKPMLQESSVCELTMLPEMSMKDSPIFRSRRDEKASNNTISSGSLNSSQICRQATDFRDVVKNSMYRETHGLSIQMVEEPKRNHLIRLVDSPRLRPMDDVPASHFRATIHDPSEHEEILRSSSSLAKDSYSFSPRLSYDGRYIPRTSLDTLESTITASRFRDLPRLSLDSRELSMLKSESGTKANAIAKGIGRSSSHKWVSQTMVTNLDFREAQKNPSVVAKLMGLEAMPDITYLSQNIGEEFDKSHSSSSSLKTVKEGKRNRLASPKSTIKVNIIPHRSLSQPKMAIEMAPWRQSVKGHTSPRRNPGNLGSHVKQKRETVYSEIQRKLKDLEFQSSNKNLRALKQIIGAIQAKGLLDTKKGEVEHPSELSNKNFESPTLNNERHCRDSHPIQTLNNNTCPQKTWDSPIVIMKPVKFVKQGVCRSTLNSSDGLVMLPKVPINDATDRHEISVNSKSQGDRTPKDLLKEGIGQVISDKKPSCKNGESTWRDSSKASMLASQNQKLSSEKGGAMTRNSYSSSPRLQHKSLPVDKKACPPPSSNLDKQQKSCTQLSESVSPRSKPIKPKQRPGMGNSNSEGNENSLRRNGNISSVSRVDVGPRRSVQSSEQDLTLFHETRSPSRKVATSATLIARKKKDQYKRESNVSTEGAATPSEQPSPVSVLDALLDKDNLSDSPVKTVPYPSEGPGSVQSSTHIGKPLLDICPTREINQRKLRDIENLVQKLKQLGSTDNIQLQTSHIASLCKTQNPNHHYISEILLASGILTAFPLFQLHHSGYPVNPELFLVLEQKKYGKFVKLNPICQSAHKLEDDPERVRRRLTFDAINEILVRKLDADGTHLQPLSWIRAGQLSKSMPSGQLLLKELCIEIEHLENCGMQCPLSEGDNGEGLQRILSQDIAQQLQGWTDLGSEVCTLVLDIERSIFKDMIDEVVCGGALTAQLRPCPRRRQLFA